MGFVRGLFKAVWNVYQTKEYTIFLDDEGNDHYQYSERNKHRGVRKHGSMYWLITKRFSVSSSTNKIFLSDSFFVLSISSSLSPVIGWTIVTNSLSLEALSFFLIIFFWTPSHFWALSLYKVGDYKRAKIPMLPVTNGIENTKKNIFVYSLLMLPTLALPYIIGFVGELFLFSTFGLTIYYILLCYALLKTKEDSFDLQKAKRVFGYSIFYLFFIFVLFLIDKLF